MIGLKHDDVIKNSLDLSYYFINFLEILFNTTVIIVRV